jgi:hypothetical protein
MPVAVRVFGWLLVILSMWRDDEGRSAGALGPFSRRKIGSAAALVIGALGGLIYFRKAREVRTRRMPAVAVDPMSECEDM